MSPPPPPPDPSGRVDVVGLDPSECADLMAAMGQPRYRGGQLFSAVQKHGATDFRSITVLPESLRRDLGARCRLIALQPLQRQADPGDGTVKYLFELPDGQTVETVLMRYRFGYSACVSSQVGCRMGCRFCASTIGGLQRNLSAAEMVAQVLACNRDLADPRNGADPDRFPQPVVAEGEGTEGEPDPASHDVDSSGAVPMRVSRIVVMGMGEPMENLQEVLRFLSIVHDGNGAGIGWRHMTVSTSGLPGGILELAEAGLPITLAVSLHAPNDEIRDRLVPLNRLHPLGELLPACRAYQSRTGRRLTFEYVMIAGENDLPEHARELGRLLRGIKGHCNLIPLNPVAERDLRPSPPESIARFAALLRGAGIPATVRRTLGTSIDAACGQLRRRSVSAASSPMPR